MHVHRTALSFGLLLVTAATGNAQSFNVDYGSAFGTPSSSYGAAANQPGLWNAVDANTPPVALKDVDGNATRVRVFEQLPFGPASFDDPATSGDDEALMDDYLDLHSVPHTFEIHGLQPGPQMVNENLGLTYTMVWSLVIANIFAGGLCFLASGQLAKLATLRWTLMLDRSATSRGDAEAASRPLVRGLFAAMGTSDRVAVTGSDQISWGTGTDVARTIENQWASNAGPFDLTRALQQARPEGAPVLLVSGGLVADDRAAIAAAQKLGVPVHVIGIGPAPARGLLAWDDIPRRFLGNTARWSRGPARRSAFCRIAASGRRRSH